MKKGRRFVSTAAALLGLVAGMGFGGPATALQSVDPCYKLCYMKQSNQSKAEKQDCNRRCKASDRYKCDSKCIKTYANSQQQYDCRKKCVGLPGGW
jgi:hypothetical protein